MILNKKLASINYYLYIYSSLKDSYVCGDKLITDLHNGIYTIPLRKFHSELSRRTTRGNLPLMYKILEGNDGSPTELRLILRCPSDWTPRRFQEEALKLWCKNPSVEELLSCHTEQTADMDLTFLSEAWKGPS
jgi:hypothetical protein